MSGMPERICLRKAEVLFRMRSRQPGKGVEMRPMREVLSRTKRCHLLAGSMRVSSEYIGSGTVLAPESDFDWDDE